MPSTLRALAVEVAHDVAGVGLGRVHRTLTMGSSSTGLRLERALLERLRAGQLERHFRRVDRVLLAVDQADAQVDHREVGQQRPRAAPRARRSRPPGCSCVGTEPPTDLVDELEAAAPW